MSLPPCPSRALSRALAAGAALLLLAAVPAAADTPASGDFDARSASGRPVPPRAEAARDALRERLGRFGLVAEDARTGTARSVAKLDGFLTPPSDRPGEAIALDYVRANPRVFGLDGGDVDALRLADRRFTGGVEYLAWQQRYRGIPSSDTQLRAAVTGAGRLMTVTGPAAADLAVSDVEPSVGAEAAYAAVRRSGRAGRPAVAVRSRAADAQRTTTFADGGKASLVLYQGSDGTRLGWRVLAPVAATEVYDATVDATTGAVVRRANRVDFADALVYPSSPLFPPSTESLDGWLADPARLDSTRVHAIVDAQDAVGVDPATFDDGEEVGPQQDGNWAYELTGFSSPRCAPVDCTWNPFAAHSWAGNRKQSATQLFYLANRFLDHLAAGPIAFDDAGLGFGDGDPVLAQAMDGADPPGDAGVPDADHVNNAGFLTLPDGTPAHLLSFLFSRGTTGATPFRDVDAANDASVIFHELTHGLTSRLVTDGQGFAALDTPQAGAIAEGTSDYFALDYLVAEGLVPDGNGLPDVRLGRYLDGGSPDGFRYQPIDCTPSSSAAACPAPPGTDGGGFRYGDFGDVYGEPEVHADGEIWAQTLWSLRQALGVAEARRLVTAGLRLAPPQPSFLDMRNAILQANTGDDTALWNVFAARGMGYLASTDGSRDLDPVPSSGVPPAPGQIGTVTGSVEDEQGAPLAGAAVGIAGHDTVLRDAELGAALADTTDANGAYTIDEVPAGTYGLLSSHLPGHRDGRATSVVVTTGGTRTVDLVMARDWASSANGAEIEPGRFTGPDNTDSGCGPGGLIDDDPGTVWGSDSAGGQTIVVDLGVPVDLDQVAIDPGAGCGDDLSAGLKDYAVRAATGPDGPFQPVAAGGFPPLLGGFLRDVATTDRPASRFVELRALTPQSTNGDGAVFLDVAELHVARTSGSTLGPSTETGAATSVSTRTARLAGSVAPHDGDVTTAFQYGTSTNYELGTASRAVPAGDTAVPVTRDLSGLQPNTTYHYRFVATRGGVAYPGADRTFKTLPAVAPPTPTPTPTPTPQPPDDRPVVSTSIVSKRLVADRRGMFKLKWTFGDAAPAGTARVRVIGKRRKRIASAAVAVRPGRTITKTLRLTRAGRRMIRPGRSLRVTVELRLPNGGTLRERLRLTRKR